MSYFDDDEYVGPDADGSDIGSDSDEESVAPTLKRTKPTLTIEGEDEDEDEEINVDSEAEDEDINVEDDEAEAEVVPEDDDDTSYLDGEIDEDEEEIEKPVTNKKLKDLPKNLVYNIGNDDEEDDDEDNDGEQYLQKFDKEVNKNYIMDFHPECVLHNYEEISAMTNVVRDKNNVIIDPLHKTIPFLTKYEKARILGQRAKQINSGATPFVKVPENVIDGYLIAELELAEKRIPFIIRRPLPNGGSEYWNIKDLEIVGF